MSNPEHDRWSRDFEERLKIADHRFDNLETLQTWVERSKVPIAWPPGVKEHLIDMMDEYVPFNPAPYNPLPVIKH